MFFLDFLAWLFCQQIVDPVAINHVNWYLEEHLILDCIIIIGALLTINLNWIELILWHDLSGNAKSVVCTIDWQNWLRVCPIVFDKTAAIQIISTNLVRVLYYWQYIFDSSWHNTALFSHLAVDGVSLAWLGGTKEDHGAIFTLDEVLNEWLDTLAVELILFLGLTEDIIKLKYTCIISIYSASLPA